MKEVIDVMQLQTQRGKSSDASPQVNYKLSQSHFMASRFIFECGVKLGCQPLTIATSCTLYHKFFRAADSKDYDVYLIAATCLYLAGKLEGQPLKLRDIINVTNATLHRTLDTLELGDEYWGIRDGIVQAELLVLRMLCFQLQSSTHPPHRYLLHYCKSLEDWIGPEGFSNVPVARTAWSLLQDFHHDSAVTKYKPQHIALAILNLALQCHGVSVPCTTEGNNGPTWYSVFNADLSKDILWEIMDKVMDVYDHENEMYPDMVFSS